MSSAAADDKIMEEFAHAIKHRKFADEREIFRRLLATQCPRARADWRSVYHHVADDLARVEYRAPGALEAAAVSFDFLKDKLPAIDARPPFLEDFCERVGLPVDAPEAVPLFFSARCPPAEIIDRFPAPVYDRLRAYFDDPAPLDETAIGDFIANMELEEMPFVADYRKEKIEEKEEAPEELPAERPQFAASAVGAKEWTLESEKEFRQHPLIKAYKAERDLPNQALCLPIILDTLAPPLVAALVDYLPEATVEAIAEHEAARDFYVARNKGDTETAREFVRALASSGGLPPKLANLLKNNEA